VLKVKGINKFNSHTTIMFIFLSCNLCLEYFFKVKSTCSVCGTLSKQCLRLVYYKLCLLKTSLLRMYLQYHLIFSDTISSSQPYGPFSGQMMSAVKEGCRKAFQAQPQRLMAAMYSCSIQVNAEVLGESHKTLLLLAS